MSSPTPSVADGDQVAAPSWRRWLVLASMSLGTLVAFLDNTVVNTALPTISIELGVIHVGVEVDDYDAAEKR